MDLHAEGLFALIPCCFGLFALAAFGFWLWMLIDCLTRDFKGNDKLIWVLVIVLANWIGALIYLLVGRDKGVRSQ